MLGARQKQNGTVTTVRKCTRGGVRAADVLCTYIGDYKNLNLYTDCERKLSKKGQCLGEVRAVHLRDGGHFPSSHCNSVVHHTSRHERGCVPDPTVLPAGIIGTIAPRP